VCDCVCGARARASERATEVVHSARYSHKTKRAKSTLACKLCASHVSRVLCALSLSCARAHPAAGARQDAARPKVEDAQTLQSEARQQPFVRFLSFPFHVFVPLFFNGPERALLGVGIGVSVIRVSVIRHFWLFDSHSFGGLNFQLFLSLILSLPSAARRQR